MNNEERYPASSEVEGTTERIRHALVKAADLHRELGLLDTPNAELIQKACIAQLALLEQDLRTHTGIKNQTGSSYSAEDEALGILREIIRELRHKRDSEISAAIADLDPDKE
jgi:hypothetical protein